MNRKEALADLLWRMEELVIANEQWRKMIFEAMNAPTRPAVRLFQ